MHHPPSPQPLGKEKNLRLLHRRETITVKLPFAKTNKQTKTNRKPTQKNTQSREMHLLLRRRSCGQMHVVVGLLVVASGTQRTTALLLLLLVVLRLHGLGIQ
jgi:hypothetical protein